jgi:hypothetical protein
MMNYQKTVSAELSLSESGIPSDYNYKYAAALWYGPTELDDMKSKFI